jgi:hypothetical protein
MRWNQKKIIEFVAMEIYHKFPNRQDRRLSIGDNTPASGDCAGHPSSSHSGCCVMDTNYYTLGKTNTTQYRPGTSGDACHELTYIWNESDCDWPGNDPWRLLKNVFDWERNYYLIKRLKDFFPDGKFRISDVLKNYIASEVKKKYGYASEREFVGLVSGDDSPEWRHSHHAHFYLGDKIDWGCK